MEKGNALGQKIKELRKARALTQDQLSELLDIDNRHLSRIEQGKHLPTYSIAKRIAKVLQFDICNFEETAAEEVEAHSVEYLKSLRILNSARSEKEQRYYLEALSLAQKCIKLGKERRD